METIRNYLETMFLKLPNTPEVYKAKNELWQMMEDKYTELKEEGKSENEAVGIVISEFGNLDELANDLGISQFVESQPMPQGKTLSLDQAKSYLADAGKSAYRTSLGVMLCVLSVCGPIFFDAFTAFYPQNFPVFNFSQNLSQKFPAFCKIFLSFGFLRPLSMILCRQIARAKAATDL